jgi:pyruvate dehydrogenase E1 component alpha subunit
MSVEAVEDAIAAAAERARSGEGPTLIEAKTYRFAGHSRADTAPYRTEGELESWAERDPIKVMRKRLLQDKVMTQEEIDQVSIDADKYVSELVQFLTKEPEPEISAMFDHIWAQDRVS